MKVACRHTKHGIERERKNIKEKLDEPFQSMAIVAPAVIMPRLMIIISTTAVMIRDGVQ